MAEEVQIAQGDERAKLRHPLGVVGLSLITIGIYFFFWWYFINREMRDLGRARGADLGESPGKSVLAVTLGALIIVPPIVSMWTTSDRLQRSQESVGMQERVSGPVTFILLFLIGPVGIWYAQNELNKAWRKQSGAGAQALPPQESTQAPPPSEPTPAPPPPSSGGEGSQPPS